MNVVGIKTHKITSKDRNILIILDRYLPKLKDNQIVAITSKIVSICEGRIINKDKANKDDLIKQEADLYLPRNFSKYSYSLTVRKQILSPAAGIDDSNGNGYFILLPIDPQKTANKIRKYLCKKHKLKHLGILITDSKTSPLRRGSTGIGISHSGFYALKSYVGKKDVFGIRMNLSTVNMMDSLAAVAVLQMGEGHEQTPIAIIEDIPFVDFQTGNPTKKELDKLKIEIEDDLYAPLLTRVPWKKK